MGAMMYIDPDTICHTSWLELAPQATVPLEVLFAKTLKPTIKLRGYPTYKDGAVPKTVVNGLYTAHTMLFVVPFLKFEPIGLMTQGMAQDIFSPTTPKYVLL